MARLRTPLPTLTARQIDILKFIMDYYLRHLSYPQKAEIGRRFGASSRNINGMVRPLFRKGDLKDLPGRGLYEISEQGIERLQAMGVEIPSELVEFDKQEELAGIH